MRSSDHPHWREVRERLRHEGVVPDDAAVVDWEMEGSHLYCGVIGTRDERLFHFCVIFGYDRHRRATEDNVGFVDSWKRIPPDEIDTMPGGRPNGWLWDLITSRHVLNDET
jgi:hypothetical protein